MLRLLRSVLLALVGALLVLVAPGLPSSAHDELLESDPADGATLEAAPSELRLTFGGQIVEVGAQVAVTGPTDAPLRGTPRIEGAELVQELTGLAPGAYEVLWRVTSEDGHPISGAFAFSVEGGDDAAASGAATGAATSEPAATQTATTGTTATTAPAADPAETTAQADDEGGVPAWTWAVVGVAVLGLGALLARTWARGRS